MNTSDIVSRGSRPLNVLSSLYYRQQPKDALASQLAADVEQPTPVPTSFLDSSQYEFPGDRTYARYLSTRTGG